MNSTVGVGTGRSRGMCYQNRFARPLDRGTGAPTGERLRNLCECEPPVERRPVDVTTRRTTPQRSLTTAPSPAVVKLNGGVPWIPAEWRHRSDPVIPNRWLSESRHVRLPLGTLPALRGSNLPGPQAQRMCCRVHHRIVRGQVWDGQDRPKPTAKGMCGSPATQNLHRLA